MNDLPLSSDHAGVGTTREQAAAPGHLPCRPWQTPLSPISAFREPRTGNKCLRGPSRVSRSRKEIAILKRPLDSKQTGRVASRNGLDLRGGKASLRHFLEITVGRD